MKKDINKHPCPRQDDVAETGDYISKPHQLPLKPVT
jgi:hypothetical protein